MVHLKRFPTARHQIVLLHQANNPFAADGFALLEEITVNSRAPVAVLTCLERGTDPHTQLLVALGVRRGGPRLPGVEARRAVGSDPDNS